MRAYLIDEISPSDMKKVSGFLREVAISSSLDDLFWVKLPHDFLNGEQFEHRHCKPHVFAVELGFNFVKLELFVRSLKGMRCTCPGYCTEKQLLHVFDFAHGMLDQLGIRT
ncbi:MAG: hypothetical protein V1689_01440 [Pseudomonadota bacterium]